MNEFHKNFTGRIDYPDGSPVELNNCQDVQIGDGGVMNVDLSDSNIKQTPSGNTADHTRGSAETGSSDYSDRVVVTGQFGVQIGNSNVKRSKGRWFKR